MSTLTSIDGPALHGRRSAGKPTAVNDVTRPTVVGSGAKSTGLGSGVEPTAALKPVAVKQPAAATTTYCPLTARRTTAEPSTAVALTANARATATPHGATGSLHRAAGTHHRSTAKLHRATGTPHGAAGSLHRATGTPHRETPLRNRDARLRRRYGYHQARRVGPGRCRRAAGSKW
ncbi:hypothetical protein M1D51_00970 [Arthrobacter sp. R3-55]